MRGPQGEDKNRGDWRKGAPRRGFAPDDGVAARPKPPTMSRSRTQLATTYAPGVLFTWEGAKGICRAVPIAREIPDLPEATRELIFDGIKEIASNWLDRGNDARQDPIPIDLLLDDVFYDPRTHRVDRDWRQMFELTDPGIVGYVPYPLLYRCAVCGRIREFSSIDEQARERLPRRCSDHESRWTQLDVVYVHWSGALEPLSPFRYDFDNRKNDVVRYNSCTCGGQDFKLDNRAPIFSEWRFICESCGKSRELVQQDPLTLRELTRLRQTTGRNFERIEVDMLPVSYRANSAFYPQKGTFIEFKDRSVVDLMRRERDDDLTQRIADIHAFPYARPSENEIQASLAAAGKSAEWEDYQYLLKMASDAPTQTRADRCRQDAADMREGWYTAGLVRRGSVQSSALLSAVARRSSWARRYDPLRLTVEHQRFRVEQIDERRPRHESVDVLMPDAQICDAVGDPVALARYRETVGSLLARLGISHLELIRGLPICEFSFGYTRVSPSPIYDREFGGRVVAMPVRLNAFPELPGAQSKRPVYVTRQKNEALYFQLDVGLVRRWLVANGLVQAADVSKSVGAMYLEEYQDFGQFLDAYKGRDGMAPTARSLTAEVYLLLHTLAHQAMHALADISGLDRDGLGEYLFPADLAFVVYRRGMTPDLGNISAMWRNHSADFLRRMLDPRTLRCGSGSLCDSRGGACPACVMVSEVTCIAGNQLLSRAALKGGPAPTWEGPNQTPLVGYFDVGMTDG